ncbi:MAG: arsenate reductase (glutaredoxin) [Planctomycetota bacterium]
MTAADITLYHNPNCSKCRQAVALLEEREVPYELRSYLDKAPTRDELERLLDKLGTEDPRVMMREKDERYERLGLVAANRATLLDALLEHPTLLQRPIAVRGGRALIARPPERLLDLLDDTDDTDGDEADDNEGHG